MVSTETKLFTSRSSGLNDVTKIMNLHFEKSLSMLFRIFALNKTLRNHFDTDFEERFLFTHTSARVFALFFVFFLGGGGGEGMVRG